MPPFIARKRRRSSSSPTSDTTPRRKAAASTAPTKSDLKRSLSANKKLIAKLDDSSDDQSLSEVSSDEFEDVLPHKKQKAQHGESDNESDWENVLQPDSTTPVTPGPVSTGDLELTLSKEQNFGSLTNTHGTKKGPSKIERQIRVATHQIHVQFLMFHNAMRNAWACDLGVQEVLVKQLPPIMVEQVKLWRRASGLPDGDKQKPGRQQKGKGKSSRGGKTGNHHNQRDWGQPALRQEQGAPDMSRGDPLLKLLKELVVYWKRAFRFTAPSLRKQGYKPMNVLQEEVSSFHNDSHDPEEHGEKMISKAAFLKCARKLEGSRDVGAQLFTTLLRGLGIESRLVASLQPVGFGWSKAEDATAKKKRVAQPISESSSSSDEDEKPSSASAPRDRQSQNAIQSSNSKNSKSASVRHQTKRGAKDTPINLDSSTSELSDAPSVLSEPESVEELKLEPVKKRKSNFKYDRDMVFPNSWVEAISPITHKVIPVDPVVSHTVVSNEEHLVAFEPRGKKADKAKQVMAYVIAYSSDGTAKDVTTRYLKRHLWPGRTKGFRMPVEKIAIKNRRGKVKGYGYFDWFKRVMSGYTRADKDRTTVDDIEDATDLKPVKPEKKQAKDDEEIDTLQGYKQSAHYVLQRFLRREEALLPGSELVKMFTTGKGDKATEEPVYLRKDVVQCKTAESWHKEGRQIKVGEQPLKSVPIRAVTLTRKLEVEAQHQQTGTKPLQGMYSIDQTEYIIPPPIENGVIPKNAFGNIDCFVPSMIPQGATHVPYRGTVRVCKRLGIDYAEAVTGFEFGNKRAVPVCQGVVIAEENEQMVMDELVKDEEERKRKEDEKRVKAALTTWKKFYIGLRIVERVREEYGAEGQDRDEINPFTNPSKAKTKANDTNASNETAAAPMNDEGGGFIADDEEQAGGFVIED